MLLLQLAKPTAIWHSKITSYPPKKYTIYSGVEDKSHISLKNEVFTMTMSARFRTKKTTEP